VAAREKKATIYDVAHEASVSISTVSRVLNDPARVKAETRKAVLSAIDMLNFVPQPQAVARAQKNLKRVGVMTPFFTEASFVQRIRGISEVLSPANYELIIYTVKTAAQLEQYLDLLPTGDRIDGLIVLSLRIGEPALARLKSSGMPVVFVEEAPEGFSSILVDNQRGGYLGASYLLHKGYHSVGFVGEYSSQPFTVDATESRLEGFISALRATQTSEIAEWIHVSEFGDPALIRWLDDLFDTGTYPRSIMCSSDLLAAKTIQRAHKHGIDVPGELAVLGFDNLDLSGYLNLSTVSQELDYSGRLAGEMIRAGINDEDPREGRQVFLNLSVIERGSC
jgi:LacI family transcriptional regulator